MGIICNTQTALLQALHGSLHCPSCLTAAEFAELEKAYRVLTDANARGALDDYLKCVALAVEVACSAPFL
jgi:hypothetical protein